MKQLFKQYKPVLHFLGVFIGSYLVLVLLYGVYLRISSKNQSPDFITQKVAKQSEALLLSMDYNAQVIPSNEHPSMQLWVENEWVGKIVEGCNALSIIILFIAFVLAFSQGFKKTLLFIFAGSVLIYAFNIVRIVILAVTLYKYPEHQEFLHTVVFPGLIYGLVFLLWVAWVKATSTKKKLHAASN